MTVVRRRLAVDSFRVMRSTQPSPVLQPRAGLQHLTLLPLSPLPFPIISLYIYFIKPNPPLTLLCAPDVRQALGLMPYLQKYQTHILTRRTNGSPTQGADDVDTSVNAEL